MDRLPVFFLIYFVVPSLIFVFIAYTSFWINKEAVPARVAIGIISILINISTNNSVTTQIPQVPYTVELSSFLMGSLFFTVLAMMEFSLLNWGSTTYNKMRIKLNEKIIEVKKYEKNKAKEESDEGLKALKEMREQA